jgi:hypothetical protein
MHPYKIKYSQTCKPFGYRYPVLADPVHFDRIRIRPLKKKPVPDPDPTQGYKIPLTEEIVQNAAVLSSFDQKFCSFYHGLVKS